MEIFVGIVAWIITGITTESTQIGFFFGLVVAVLYKQHIQISDLIAQRGSYKKTELPSISQVIPSEPRPSLKTQEPAAPQQPTIPTFTTPVHTTPAIKSPTPPPALKPTPIQTPPSPSFSEFIESALGKTAANFILQGNPIARIGVIILFFGVSFALKLAADQGLFPIEVRLPLAAIGGATLIAFGVQLASSKKLFAMTLEGAGAGVLYITTFAAFRIYDLIPAPLSFAVLVIITVFIALLALRQDARALAVLSLAGGFLAPVLASNGGGSHIGLFTYFAILNFGVFAICVTKPWKEVSFVGMLFTLVISAAWGAKYYKPEFFSTTEPFLIFFLVIYTAIAVSFALRSKEKDPLNVGLIFAPPFFASILQYNLTNGTEYGVSISASLFGAAYLCLSRYLKQRYSNIASATILTEAYSGIGLTLISIAVPFAFSPHITSAIWSLEAVALIWFGVRQNQWLTRLGGEVLITLATFFFIADLKTIPTELPFLNPYFLGVVLLTASYLSAAHLLLNADPVKVNSEERGIGDVFTFLSILWWSLGAGAEIERHLFSWSTWCQSNFTALDLDPVSFNLTVFSVFATFTVTTFSWAGEKWRISGTRHLRKLLMPIHAVILSIFIIENGIRDLHYRHPLGGFGLIAWAAAFIAHYRMAFLNDKRAKQTDGSNIHALPLWLITILTTFELSRFVSRLAFEGTSWVLSVHIIVPAIIVSIVSLLATSSSQWPWKPRGKEYLSFLIPLGMWIFYLPLVFDFYSSGSAEPLPYIPLLNPLDIAQSLSLMTIVAYLKRAERPLLNYKIPLSIGLFIWSTSILLRSVHHYAGVPWKVVDLLESTTMQSCLSIYWSLLSLILMWTAHHRSWREVWKAGAVLIGIVVGKLFFIDLASHGSTGRIVAFLGVGLLMLGIGYVAPIPPDKKAHHE